MIKAFEIIKNILGTKVADDEDRSHKYNIAWKQNRNFIEHAYDIKIVHQIDKIPDINPAYPGIRYGHTTSVSVVSDVYLAKTALYFTSLDHCHHGTEEIHQNDKDFSSTIVFCNPHSTDVLYIGKHRFELRFYTKDIIIKVLKQYGVHIVT